MSHPERFVVKKFQIGEAVAVQVIGQPTVLLSQANHRESPRWPSDVGGNGSLALRTESKGSTPKKVLSLLVLAYYHSRLLVFSLAMCCR